MSLWKRLAVILAVISLFQSFYIFKLSHTSPPPPLPPSPLSPSPPSHSPIQQHYDHHKISNFTLWQQLFPPKDTQLESELLTIVMLTYKREDLLPRVAKHYCVMRESIKTILIIWNDIENKIPDNLLDLSSSCQVELKFIVSKENKLTNRFLPRQEILTEGVLTVDDDRLISREDVHFGLQIWQQNRHKIVGFEHRMHSVAKSGVYRYGPAPQLGHTPEKLGYSMLISASFILHKVYLELFHSSFLPRGVFAYINKEMNCEDIAMCVMVGKFLQETSWPQSSVLSIKPKVTLQNLEAMTGGEHRGLSNKLKHYGKRSECLNTFSAYYEGHLPLVYTSGRIYREPFNPWYKWKLT